MKPSNRAGGLYCVCTIILQFTVVKILGSKINIVCLIYIRIHYGG
jgi:hypothetical protein